MSTPMMPSIQINSFDTLIHEMKVMRVRHQQEMKQLLIKFQQHLNEKEENNNNNNNTSPILPNRENKNFRNINDSSSSVVTLSSFIPSRTHHSFVRCKL